MMTWGALRIVDPQHPDRMVVAAGAPWFMALFGRDSLLASFMVLPLDASLALGTLQTLADRQGAVVDLLTEEQPGRILHEVRLGIGTGLALGGKSAYYGSADATPLFVTLLGEVSRWGIAAEDISALLPHADYVYSAYHARAWLAHEAGDHALADEFVDRAKRLKKRFNEQFWLPDRGYFAIALDRDKRPVDAPLPDGVFAAGLGVSCPGHDSPKPPSPRGGRFFGRCMDGSDVAEVVGEFPLDEPASGFCAGHGRCVRGRSDS